MENEMRIVLDVDGVICDFEAHWLGLAMQIVPGILYDRPIPEDGRNVQGVEALLRAYTNG
jgi:hypothetical protein